MSSRTKRSRSTSSAGIYPPVAAEPDRPTQSTRGQVRNKLSANSNAIVWAAPFADLLIVTRGRDFSMSDSWPLIQTNPSWTLIRGFDSTIAAMSPGFSEPPSRSLDSASIVGA